MGRGRLAPALRQCPLLARDDPLAVRPERRFLRTELKIEERLLARLRLDVGERKPDARERRRLRDGHPSGRCLDAVLNKRAEGATGSVDKMENAMQNIILQEMEQMEGIMIATTNLTGSLDAAFERRFLYKLEFEKPAPKERMNIWRAMLPELTEQEALSLAEQFDFSGGQIENIARKQAINSILSDADEVSMDAVIENCKTELLEKKSRQRIGF